MPSPQIPLGMFAAWPMIQLALGSTPGISCFAVNGSNPSVGVGTSEDVWSGGGAWPQPVPTGGVLTIVSDNATDTAASTGARTVKITGLSTTYDIVTETLIMNGLTPVTGAVTFILVQTAEVLTAGTGLTNTGTLTIGMTGGPAVMALILPGMGQTQSAVYVVPRGYRALLLGWQAGTQGAGAQMDVRVFVQPFNGAYRVVDEVGLTVSGTSHIEVPLICPEPLAEKTIIKLRALSQAGSGEAHGGFAILLLRTV